MDKKKGHEIIACILYWTWHFIDQVSIMYKNWQFKSKMSGKNKRSCDIGIIYDGYDVITDDTHLCVADLPWERT